MRITSAFPRWTKSLTWMLLLLLVTLPSAGQNGRNAPAQRGQATETWLREHPVLRVGVFTGGYLPMETWMGGQPDGLAVDYVRLLATRAGLQIVFQPFSDWDAIANAADDAPLEFDLLLGLIDPPQQGGRYRLLPPYHLAKPVLVLRSGDRRYPEDLLANRARLVIDQRYQQVAGLLEASYPDVVVSACASGPECLQAVAEGKADAYVGPSIARMRVLLQDRPQGDLRLADSAGLPSFGISAGVRRDAAELVRKLQQAAASIDSDELAKLRQRWLGDETFDDALSQTLTTQERHYLAGLPVLRVGYEVDRHPYSFVSGQGRFEGLASEYLLWVKEQLGLRVQWVPAANWDELQQMVRERRVDLVASGASYDFPEQDVIFTQAFERFPQVIAAPVGSPVITTLGDLAGKTVAVRNEAGMIAQLSRQVEDMRLVPVVSNEAGMALVARGEAAAYIGTLPAVDSLLRSRYAARLRVVGPVGRDQELAIGVRSELVRLLPLLDRTLASMGPAKKRAIRARWLTSDYHYGVPWGWVGAGSALVALILAAGIFAYLRLHRAARAQAAAERALARQLDFQRMLMEAVPCAIFVKDAEGRYLAVNSAYETLSGCTRGQLIGHAFCPPALSACHSCDAAPALSPALAPTEVMLAQGGEGTEHPWLYWRHPFHYEPESGTEDEGAGDRSGWLGMLVDLSAVRQAEARARTYEQRLYDITTTIPATVFQFRQHTDGTRRFTYLAGDVIGLIGVTAEHAMAAAGVVFDRIHPDDLAALNERIDRTTASLQAMPPFDFRIRGAGGWRWLRTEGGPPRRVENDAIEWSGYWIDTSTAHEQAQALREAKARAESAVTAKTAFLASMSHEIRTPMAGVLGLLELLERTALDHEQEHLLSLADDSARNLLQILDDILDYSGVESGRLNIANQPFEPRRLVDGIAGLFSARAREKRLRMYATQDSGIAVQLRGDEARIRQVLVNLVSNALKFTDHGHVAISMHALARTGRRQRVRFLVEDTGIGIAASDLVDVFEPFTQVEQAADRRSGGTGLGLAISRRLALHMGGDLRLESVPGQGTRAIFEVDLDVVGLAAAPSPFRGRRARVDCTDMLRFREVVSILAHLGFDVRMEGDATDADVHVMEQEPASTGVAGQCSLRIVAGHASAAGASFVVSADPVLSHAMEDACRRVLGRRLFRVPATEPGLAGARSGRILVAEDHPTGRILIARQLEALGYRHTLVEDGQYALEALASAEYDLLLTDCHLPRLDGCELTRAIRTRETGQRLPIIALSASALPEQVQRCMDAGMDGFLAKPIHLEALGEALDRHLAGSRESPGRPTGAIAGPFSGHEGLARLLDAFGDAGAVIALLEDMAVNCQIDLDRLQALDPGDDRSREQLLHRLEGLLRILIPSQDDGQEPAPLAGSLEERERDVHAYMDSLRMLLGDLRQAE